MSDLEEKLAIVQAANLGITTAFQDAIRALIKLQPDMDAVFQVMSREREETMALILAKNWPDTTIDAYRDTIDSLRPHLDGDDMSPP